MNSGSYTFNIGAQVQLIIQSILDTFSQWDNFQLPFGFSLLDLILAFSFIGMFVPAVLNLRHADSMATFVARGERSKRNSNGGDN